jgi:hypothetical protein
MKKLTIEEKLHFETDANLIKMSQELTQSTFDHTSLIRQFLTDHHGNYTLIQMIGLGANMAVELGKRYDKLLTIQKQVTPSNNYVEQLRKKYNVFIPSTYKHAIHCQVGELLGDDKPHNKVRAIQYLTSVFKNFEFEVKDIKEFVNAVIKIDYKGTLPKNQ